MERPFRPWESVIVLAVLAAMLAIAFWPTPVDAPFDGLLLTWLRELHSVGVPLWFDYTFVEVGANVVLFAPIGALIAAVLWPSLWWVSGVLGLALSLIIEFGQYLLLPHRFASAGDVIANTIGALCGGLIVACWRLRVVFRGTAHRGAHLSEHRGRLR